MPLLFPDRSRPPGFKSSMNSSTEDLPNLENSTEYLSANQDDTALTERKRYFGLGRARSRRLKPAAMLCAPTLDHTHEGVE